ncbi:MAG: cyclopropane-fatty-acyl-phospholipid synthase family protein [Chromatiales bacterium]|jgi:cyclopropane-fatty-acyl-phospholipid synthase
MSAEERALPATAETSKWHPLHALFRAAGAHRKIDIAIGRTAHPDSDRPQLLISNPVRLLSRLAMRGDLGFAESYMAGEWDTNDLTALLKAIGANESGSRIRQGLFSERMRERVRHALRSNSRHGSRRNIAYHYDLSNAFYSRWLDPSMTYSSAIFDEQGLSLEAAQKRKYQRLLDALNAQPGDHILEIGCGWGGFAQEAARRGCRVTGLTLSREQLGYARNRIREAGLEELVTLEFRDYRDLSEQYDHIVSIEMFEAVGERYWPLYFEKLGKCLRPGGKAALQIITIDGNAYHYYRRRTDFIQRYIFPGGMLPPVERLEQLAQDAGLVIEESYLHGHDYARTLKHWHRAFDACRDEISALGFDEGFRRMWKYYLSYCETGFLLGRIDLLQLVLSGRAA